MVEKWENDILEISMNQSNLKQDLLEMKEMRYVLGNIGTMLGSVEIGLDKILAKYVYTLTRWSTFLGQLGIPKKS